MYIYLYTYTCIYDIYDVHDIHMYIYIYIYIYNINRYIHKHFDLYL